jgi:hypothetical protein
MSVFQATVWCDKCGEWKETSQLVQDDYAQLFVCTCGEPLRPRLALVDWTREMLQRLSALERELVALASEAAEGQEAKQ